MGYIGDMIDAQLVVNCSKFANTETANTNKICADQRAATLWQLGVTKVLELCVGPSLSVLEQVYKERVIQCYGNDIDSRWKDFHPKGNWIIGDAIDVFKENYQKFDAVVFAPPLSNGCSGRREDSLSIDDVNPKYSAFIKALISVPFNGYAVLTLPGRSLSTKEDREQFFKLTNSIKHVYSDVRHVDLIDGCRKYIDVYIRTASLI